VRISVTSRPQTRRVALGFLAFPEDAPAPVHELVPPHRLRRAITSLYLFGLSAACLAQWLTGLLVGLSAAPGRIGSPLGYRLVFGFLALILLGALLIYRRAPRYRVATATPPAPDRPARSAERRSATPR